MCLQTAEQSHPSSLLQGPSLKRTEEHNPGTWCIHSGIAVHSHKHLGAPFWHTVTYGWLLQAQLLNYKTCCMGHERMTACSQSEEVVHLEVAFCQYQSKIPCLLSAMFASPPEHTAPGSAQKLVADKKAPLGQDSKRETVQAHMQSSRWFNQCILTSRESTCSCPQFHTSSLSPTLLRPMASYLRRE